MLQTSAQAIDFTGDHHFGEGQGLDAPEAPQVILLEGSARNWEPHRRLDSGQLILTGTSFSGCFNRKLGC
jgi:hypothetical protein